MARRAGEGERERQVGEGEGLDGLKTLPDVISLRYLQQGGEWKTYSVSPESIAVGCYPDQNSCQCSHLYGLSPEGVGVDGHCE